MRYPALLRLAVLAIVAACRPDISAPPSPTSLEQSPPLTSVRTEPTASAEVGALLRGMGHYCNKTWFNSPAWSFDYGSADPCASAPAGGTIARAGMYSLAGSNRVVLRCLPNLTWRYEGTGAIPLAQAKATASGGRHQGSCTFTVSPRRIAWFDWPYPANASLPANYHGSGFDFDRPPYGSAFTTVDHRGQQVQFIDNHDAHDFGMPKGTPLLAVADGVIITAGMFWGQYTNCNRRGLPQNPNLADCGRQGIVIVRHTLPGGSPTYDETFATGYFHIQSLPQWILNQCTAVDTTQAWPGVGGVCSIPVTRGQVIAYSGRRSTNQAHLHFATWRLTNTHAQGHKVGDAALYSPSCCTVGGRGPTLIVDPYGWRGTSSFDPWSYKAAWPTPTFPNGAGALSVSLFKVDPPIHWQ